jgi:nitrogen fixation-related uncharacterized protein
MEGSFGVMAVMIGILALALLGYFVFMWAKDKGRSDDESSNPARQQTDRSEQPRDDEPGGV